VPSLYQPCLNDGKQQGAYLRQTGKSKHVGNYVIADLAFKLAIADLAFKLAIADLAFKLAIADLAFKLACLIE
jgi:hypothetical protein